MIDVSLARRLKLVGLDVDGVLTDNGIYVGMVGDHPVELKRFHIQDGLGIKLLRDAGLVVVLASARRSEATELRARELKVDEVVQDKRKLPAFEDLLRRVGLPIAVANAVAEVVAAAQLVTRAPGGQGAVREVAEHILQARGEWHGLVTKYFVERGDVAHGAERSR